MRLDRIKLNTALLRADVTQKALAEKAGLTRSTINNVCTGKSCSEATAIKIANALGVKLSEIRESR